MSEQHDLQAFDDGRAAYPLVDIERAAFVAEYHARVRPGPLSHGADMYLAIAASLGDEPALEYITSIINQAAPSLRCYESSDTFVAEVLQRVRINMLVPEDGSPPRLARYDGRASLRTWIGVCVTRMGLYVLRSRRNAREVATDWIDVLSEVSSHPELESVRAHYAETFGAAWREACAGLPPRQRAVLRMCFVDGCAIETIAATYGVHRVTVWRWLEDAKQQLLDGTRARLGERLKPGDPGTQSLLELVRSKLDLRLSELGMSA